MRTAVIGSGFWLAPVDPPGRCGEAEQRECAQWDCRPFGGIGNIIAATIMGVALGRDGGEPARGAHGSRGGAAAGQRLQARASRR
jgi:hypothetical protein